MQQKPIISPRSEMGQMVMHYMISINPHSMELYEVANRKPKYYLQFTPYISLHTTTSGIYFFFNSLAFC